MLAEFRQVVRPGGLAALKEWDSSLIRVVLASPGVILR